MKKERGFSLMEMMVVLLIVSVTTAATAPMLNKKTQGEASEKSPWSWVDAQSIFYNGKGDRNQTITFGALNKPDGENARVYVDAPNTIPHIAFGNGGNNIARLFANGSHILFTGGLTDATGIDNAVAIGSNLTVANNSFVLGSGSLTNGPGAIVIGNNSSAGNAGGGQTLQSGSIAIGSSAGANAQSSVAIGFGAEATAQNSIALGTVIIDNGANSIAVGSVTLSNNIGNSIVIGNYFAQQANSGIVAIGSSVNDNNNNVANGDNSITIGTGALSRGGDAVSIGTNANRMCQLGACDLHTFHTVAQQNAVAIGNRAYTGDRSVAIGTNAAAMGNSSIAIGNRAEANNVTAWSSEFGIAIGNGAVANDRNEITIGDYISYKDGPNAGLTLGTNSQTVYIPGKLIVDSDVTLKGSKIRLENLPEKENSSKKLKGELRSHLHTSGLFEAVGIDTSYSDCRLKNVGESFKAGLEEIKKLEIFHYTFKKDPNKTPRVGVMAQDLQKIFPDAVFKGEDGFLRIRMEDMFYAVVNAVKEINIRANEQNKKLAELNKQNKELKKRALKLKKRINKLAKNKKNINEDSLS